MWTKEEKAKYAKSYREKNKEKRKQYLDINKKKIKGQTKKWREDNKDKKQRLDKKYNETHKEERQIYLQENKEKFKKYDKVRYKSNKKKINDRANIYQKERRKTDPLFSLTAKIRTTISNSLRKNKYIKNEDTQSILGCSFEEFKSHLESKFEPWMNWGNRGKYNGQPSFGWDIDHIICLSGAKNVEELKKLNHYTNTQPLCSFNNRYIKRDT